MIVSVNSENVKKERKKIGVVVGGGGGGGGACASKPFDCSRKP